LNKDSCRLQLHWQRRYCILHIIMYIHNLHEKAMDKNTHINSGNEIAASTVNDPSFFLSSSLKYSYFHLAIVIYIGLSNTPYCCSQAPGNNQLMSSYIEPFTVIFILSKITPFNLNC